MDDLLKVITGNPILLFIIIGAILRFLQKGKEQEAKKETRKPGAPNTEETPSAEVDWREIFRQEEKPKPVLEKEPEQQYTYTKQPKSFPSDDNNQRSNELLEKYENAQRNKEAAKINDRNIDDSPIYKGDIAAQKEINLDFSRITKEQAIAGVVWSEILGKPRSKGSNRPSLNTRRKRG